MIRPASSGALQVRTILETMDAVGVMRTLDPQVLWNTGPGNDL